MASPVNCPKCKTDVMVTGFTLHAETTVSYMRFKGRGAVQVASTENAAAKATCMCCGAKLPLTPMDLMRAA